MARTEVCVTEQSCHCTVRVQRRVHRLTCRISSVLASAAVRKSGSYMTHLAQTGSRIPVNGHTSGRTSCRRGTGARCGSGMGRGTTGKPAP